MHARFSTLLALTLGAASLGPLACGSESDEQSVGDSGNTGGAAQISDASGGSNGRSNGGSAGGEESPIAGPPVPMAECGAHGGSSGGPATPTCKVLAESWCPAPCPLADQTRVRCDRRV